MRLPRIPDLLTTANLSCGVASILLASQGQLTLACWLVFAGAAFDVLDGLAARALGGGTPLGAQLDSLADMVTFGVAPAFVVWATFALGLVPWWTVGHGSGFLTWLDPTRGVLVGATALMICIASAWRLAKFNVDTRKADGFLGLPTPANAIFWASIVLSSCDPSIVFESEGWSLAPVWSVSNPWLLAGCSVALSILMLSSIPLPSLKFKHMKWKGNEVIFLLLGIGLVLVVLYGILAVPLILLLYLLSPLWGNVFKNAETQKR